MASRALDTQIDRLYQLPLEEFTSARNALAREAGPDAARIRSLSKPPVAAWAINQLYWRRRGEWDALIAAAENARRAHKTVLSGRSADVRAAGTVHDEALGTALKATLALLAAAGQPATDATRQAIVTTLRALPGDEAPGRLTRALQPAGFEALAGFSTAHGVVSRSPNRSTGRAPAPKEQVPGRKVDARVLIRARSEAAAADRAVREAEQATHRAEFDTAQTRREEQRAAKAVAEAREALARAESALKEAEAALTSAKRGREAAEARARDAEHTLEVVRDRAESDAAALKKIEKG